LSLIHSPVLWRGYNHKSLSRTRSPYPATCRPQLVLGVAVPIALLVRSPAAVSLALRAFTLPLLVARFLPNSSSFFGYILPIYRVQWMLVSRLWVRAIRGLERGAIAAQLIQRPRHQKPGDGSSR